MRALVRLVSGMRAAGAPIASLDALTHAERAVTELLVRGLSNDAIAKERATSVHTVGNQVAAILKKTGARSRRELMVAVR